MANSTSNLSLIMAGQSQKEVTANALFDAASPATIFGRKADATSALTWAFYGGAFRKADGSFVILLNDSVTLSADATNYLEADPADGSVSVNTAAFTTGQIPLYEIVTVGSFVSEYTDYRVGTQGDGTLY